MAVACAPLHFLVRRWTSAAWALRIFCWYGQIQSHMGNSLWPKCLKSSKHDYWRPSAKQASYPGRSWGCTLEGTVELLAWNWLHLRHCVYMFLPGRYAWYILLTPEFHALEDKDGQGIKILQSGFLASFICSSTIIGTAELYLPQLVHIVSTMQIFLQDATDIVRAHYALFIRMSRYATGARYVKLCCTVP